MANCKNCNAPLNPGDKFCSNCGTKVEGVAYCTKCGMQNSANSVNCVGCGAPLSTNHPEVASQDTNFQQGISVTKSIKPIYKVLHVIFAVLTTIAAVGCIYGLISLNFYKDEFNFFSNYHSEYQWNRPYVNGQETIVLKAMPHYEVEDMLDMFHGYSSQEVEISKPFLEEGNELPRVTDKDMDALRKRFEDLGGVSSLRKEALPEYRNNVGRLAFGCFCGVVLFGALTLVLSAYFRRRKN